MAAPNISANISCDHHSKPTTRANHSNQHQQHHHDQSLRRREREKLLTSLWSHVWTKRQSPEWKPRRASVATCQRFRQNSNQISVVNNPSQPQKQQQQRQRQQDRASEYPNLLCSSWESRSHPMATIYHQLNDTSTSTTAAYTTGYHQYPRQQTASRLGAEKQGSRRSEATGKLSASAVSAAQSGDSPKQESVAPVAAPDDARPAPIEAVAETGSDAETGMPRELTSSQTEAASGGSSSSSGGGNAEISATDHRTTTTVAISDEPTGHRKRRVHLSRLSIDSYLPPATFNLQFSETATNESQSAKMDYNNPGAKPQPTNPTCCSTIGASKSTGALRGGELEATAGLGHRPMPASVPLDSEQPLAQMALNGELQLQDKQRKSLIYSMALKKMGGSNGCGSGKMACRMVGRRRYSSQIVPVAGKGGGGGCCCCSTTTTTCESAHHHQPNGSCNGNSSSGCNTTSLPGSGDGGKAMQLLLEQKTVSASSSRAQPLIDGCPVAVATPELLAGSPTVAATTTPMTCCRYSSDQDNRARKEATGIVQIGSERVRVRRSGASFTSMLRSAPTAPGRLALEPRGPVGELSDIAAEDKEEEKEMALFGEQETMLPSRSSNNSSTTATKRRLSSGGDLSASSTTTTNSCNLDEGANLSEVDDGSGSEGGWESGCEGSDNKVVVSGERIMLTRPQQEEEEDDTSRANEDCKRSQVCNAAHKLGNCYCEQDENQQAAYLADTSSTNLDDDDCCDNLGLESLIIESWLDDHPSFFQDYFMRKASRQLIDNWLLMHAKVSNTNLLSSQLDLAAAATTTTIPTAPQAVHYASNLQQNLQQQHHASGTMRVSSMGGFGRSTRSGSGQSGHATPVRKISATDFESRTGSGFLRPMVSTTPDGRPTFLSQPTPSSSPPPCNNNNADDDDEIETRRNNNHPQLQSTGSRGSLRSRSGSKGSEQQQQHSMSLNETLESMSFSEDYKTDERKAEKTTVASTDRDDDNDDPDQDQDEYDEDDREVKLIFELVKNICNDLDIKTLLHKILKNIAVLINADKSSLFLVCGKPGDPNRHLVSQLFNVDQDSELAASGNADQACATAAPPEASSPPEQQMDDCTTITIPWGTGLVGYVAESGQSVNIANCYDDPRFTNTIDQRTGYVTRHMLCAPILDKRNDIVGVAQVINKRDGNPFSKSDELKFKRYLQFCGIGLRNAQSYENCQLENRRNQVLLDLARMVFEEQSTIEQVVYRIMLHTQSLLECQRCQVLLIDDGSDDLEQLLQLPNSSSLYHQHSQQPSSLSLRAISNSSPAGSGVPGNDNGGTHSAPPLQPPPPPRPEWRPHCNASASAVRAASEISIHHDDGNVDDNGNGDNNNNGNNNSGRRDGDDNNGDDDDDNCGSRGIRQEGAATSAGATQLDLHQPKLFSLVFDLECDGNDLVMHSNKEASAKAGGASESSDLEALKSPLERRFPINIGITGYVAMTGETLNIEDAHQNERFDPSVDMNSNFRHKSILCMPIRNGQRQIIGVSQLINKKNGRPFNKNDEDLFEAFAIFCGLGIHNTLMYEKVLKIMAKQRVTFEVLSYHATAPLEEAKKLNSETIPSCYALNLTSLKFNDFSLDEQFMLKSCLRFFLDLDLIRRFQIDQLVFCNWILSVQKNYRKVTYHPIVGGNGLKASPVRYHNWRHAFNVSQMMFAILINTQICQALGELETLALLIACLCHDLDHRGTNNSFQIKSASPLAELYSTSTMEHHHFDQCVMILNSQGNQILANLTPDEYSRVIVLLEEAILATDLANYFQKREPFFKLVNGNQFNWSHNPEHRSLLRCMLMTACDVAAITKPWPVQKVVADLVMSEFYQQGDIEKQELNIEPIDMMNRDKRSKLPEMQIGFIDSICAPIYAAFARLFPHELGPLLDGCLTNRDIWTDMSKSNQLEDADLPLANYLINNTTTNNNNNNNTVTILPENYINQQKDEDDDGISLQNYRLDHHHHHNQRSSQLDHGPLTSCSHISDHLELQRISVVVDKQQQISEVHNQRKSV